MYTVPINDGGYFKYAKQYYEQGKYEEALDYIRNTLKYYPDHPEVLKLKNLIEKELYGYCDTSSPYDTDEQEEFDANIEALLEEENFVEALKQANIRVICYPDDDNSYLMRAQVYEAMKQPDKCFEDLDKALSIDETNPFTYSRRVMVLYYDFERDEEALKEINIGLQYADGVFTDWFLDMKATILSGQQKYEEAIECISQAISINQDTPLYYSHRAEYYSNIGEYGKAIEDYKMAIRLNPKEYGDCYDKLERLQNLQEINANAFLVEDSFDNSSQVDNTNNIAETNNTERVRTKNIIPKKSGRKVDW